MKIFSFCLFALLLIFNVELTTCQVVNDLSEYSVEEFENELEIHESIFVKFYSPSCPHCKSMAGEFVKTARDVKELDPPIALAEVDCTNDIGEHVCDASKVRGYPTLKLYKYGALYLEYSGSRDRKSMTKWLKQQHESKSKRFTSLVDMDRSQRESEKVVVSGIFDNSRNKYFAKFLTTSRKVKQHPYFQEIEFSHTFTDDSDQELDVQLKDNRVVIVFLRRPKWMKTDLESDFLYFNYHTETQDLTKWIINNAFGVVGFRNKQTDDNIHDPVKIGRLVVMYLAFDPRVQSNETHFWRNQLIPFAHQFPNIKFVISKMTDYHEQLKFRGLTPYSVDNPIIIAYDNLSVPYVMRERFNKESFSQFLQDFVDGKIESSLKVMEKKEEKKPLWKIMEEQLENKTSIDETNIDEVTGYNFSSQVSFTSNHVLLMIYQNKTEKRTLKISRIMDSLQNKFVLEGKEGVKFLRMNSTENEVPKSLEHKQVPRVYFVHSQDKTAFRYKEITVEESKVMDFMKKAAGSSPLFVTSTETKNRERIKSEL